VTALVAWSLWIAAQGSAGAPQDWVAFESPPFTGEGRPHGGPAWTFATPRLPALSAAGDEVLVAKTELVLGGAPNLTLLVLRVGGGAARSSHVLLTAAEFTGAGRGDSTTAAAGAFAALAERVQHRIADANRALAPKAFRPMGACHIEDPADDVQPACSMKQQGITCAGVAFHYAAGAVHGTWKGRAFTVGGGRAFRPGSVLDPSAAAPIPVRACLGDVWLDAERGALVALVRNECQRGGDWCVVQPRWFTARLGAAGAP